MIYWTSRIGIALILLAAGLRLGLADFLPAEAWFGIGGWLEAGASGAGAQRMVAAPGDSRHDVDGYLIAIGLLLLGCSVYLRRRK